jgi:hypothetical protein
MSHSILEPIESCSICQHVNEVVDLQQCCNCKEFICGSCSTDACKCVVRDIPMQALRLQLREASLELASLRAESDLMGAESLSPLQRTLLRAVTRAVPDLTEKLNRLDELRDRLDYSADYPPTEC